MKLTQSNLSKFSDQVSVPNYDRGKVRPGIIHIGVGNFHRAHQAVYLNDLLNAGNNPEWGIRGAGVRPADAIMRETLAAQNWLSSVVENDETGMKASVVGSMIDFLPVEDGHSPIIDAIALQETHIVSLTVTEGGYFIDASSGDFDPEHADIQFDRQNLQSPRTVFGAIVAGLERRWKMTNAPLTVMSCDNLPGNGDITRDAVLGLARLVGTDLGKWIEDNVTFPNGMVDRITPATSERERDLVLGKFGVNDMAPVFCEPFRQWVLEDRFADGRPEFDAAGVTLTKDVHVYEAMKLRILNGGHAIIAYPGGLSGIEFVHDAMDVPEIEAFLRKVMMDDVIGNVTPIAGQPPAEYLEQCITRFKNPGVSDTIERLCFDGSNRQPKFIVPALRDKLAQGETPYGLALSSALWCQYCAGLRDDGVAIPANDPSWSALQAAAKQASVDPLAWIRQEDIYGDIQLSEQFTAAFTSALRTVQDDGATAAIRAYLNR